MRTDSEIPQGLVKHAKQQERLRRGEEERALEPMEETEGGREEGKEEFLSWSFSLPASTPHQEHLTSIRELEKLWNMKSKEETWLNPIICEFMFHHKSIG